MPNRRIEPLKKVLTIDPNDEVAWFGLGKAYMEDANFEEAAKALQQCVTVKPTYSAAYYAWAQSLHKLGRYRRVPNRLRHRHRCLHEKRRRDGDKESGTAQRLAACLRTDTSLISLSETR